MRINPIVNYGLNRNSYKNNVRKNSAQPQSNPLSLSENRIQMQDLSFGAFYPLPLGGKRNAKRVLQDNGIVKRLDDTDAFMIWYRSNSGRTTSPSYRAEFQYYLYENPDELSKIIVDFLEEKELESSWLNNIWTKEDLLLLDELSTRIEDKGIKAPPREPQEDSGYRWMVDHGFDV